MKPISTTPPLNVRILLQRTDKTMFIGTMQDNIDYYTSAKQWEDDKGGRFDLSYVTHWDYLPSTYTPMNEYPWINTAIGMPISGDMFGCDDNGYIDIITKNSTNDMYQYFNLVDGCGFIDDPVNYKWWTYIQAPY